MNTHPHLFSFSFRTGTLSRERESVTRLGLSAEETGLLLQQLPQQQAVTLVRKPAPSESMSVESTTLQPHKVCTITPQEANAVEWKVDFEVDGVGGQAMPNGVAGPLAVTMQAGEVQVVLEIMRSSLPYLVGWTSTTQIAMERVIQDALGGGGPPQGDPFGL